MATADRNARNYVLAMGLSVVTLLIAIPILNVVMDPLGYARVAGWRPANPSDAERSLASSGAWPVPEGQREAKMLNAAYYRPAAVVFGSSTVWSYVDAGYAPPMTVDGQRAYNFGLPGVSIREMLAAFEHVVALKPPKRIVVGFEFYMFSADKATSPGFFDLPMAQRPSFQEDLRKFVGRRLLSADYTRAAALMLWKPVARSLGPWFSVGLEAGGLTADAPVSRSEFMRWMLDTDKIMIAALYPQADRPFRFVDDEGWSSFEAIRKMIALARTHDIELHFYLSPNHARTCETIRLMGWWPEFEQWQRGLVAVVDEDARAHPSRPPVPLWDLSCYNSVTMDPVQELPSQPAGFRYFADSVHFKTNVGYMLMDRIFSTDAASKLPSDFGVRLTRENVEPHLSEMTRAHHAYLAANRDDLAGIAQVLDTLGRKRVPLE